MTADALYPAGGTNPNTVAILHEQQRLAHGGTPHAPGSPERQALQRAVDALLASKHLILRNTGDMGRRMLASGKAQVWLADCWQDAGETR